MKKQISMFALLFSILSCRRDKSDLPPPFGVNCNILIVKNGKDFTGNYKSAYGIGVNELIEPSPYWKHYYWDIPPPGDSFAFNLPLNANSDNVYFVLIRKDNSQDTMALSYKRHFTTNFRKTYRFYTSDMNISFLSNRFEKDSSYIVPDTGDYKHVYYGAWVLLKLKS